MYVRFQFPLTFCPHKTVTARHVSVPQNILKMHLPLSMGSLLHKHLPKPLSGFCASKCTKNALTALEGDLTTCKPLPRPFSWIWEGRKREMKGNGGGKERREREEEGGKGARVGPPNGKPWFATDGCPNWIYTQIHINTQKIIMIVVIIIIIIIIRV